MARPVGGFLFGWIGDRVGRKTSMTLAVGLASLGSLMIGVAPSFASVGFWASLMLLVARLVQGPAHGGELPSSQTYLSEVAPKEKHGLWAALGRCGRKRRHALPHDLAAEGFGPAAGRGHVRSCLSARCSSSPFRRRRAKTWH